MFHYDLAHTGRSPYDTSDNPGKVSWKFASGQPIVSSPAIGVDGTIYVGTDDNKLLAMNPNGTQKWVFPVGGVVRSSLAIGSDGTLYFGAYDNKVYAVNPDGTEKWSFNTGSWVSSSPAIDNNDVVYIGSNNGLLYAIWGNNGTKKWEYDLGFMVSSSPAIGGDGTIYVGVADSYLYAFTPGGGLKWRHSTGQWVMSSPAIGVDGTIYFGCQDEHLYAVYPNNTLRWKYKTFGNVGSSPAIGGDGTIYVGSGDDNLHAIDPSGNKLWTYKTGNDIINSPVIGSEGTIYIGSNDNLLHAVHANGSLKWTVKTNGDIESTPAIGSNGVIYFGSKDEFLYAIHKVPPSPPLSLMVESGYGFAHINWQEPTDDGGSPLTKYNIYRAIGNNGSELLTHVNPDVTDYNDTTVTNGLLYRYTVQAVNEVGESTISFPVSTIPGSVSTPPKDLNIMVGDGFVKLRWSPPDDDGGMTVMAYKVYRGLQENDLGFLIKVDGGGLEYDDYNVENGVNYHYQVTALNHFGDSAPSGIVNATPITTPLMPTDLIAQAGDGLVDLTWSPPSDDGGGMILGYRLYKVDAEIIDIDGQVTTYNDMNVTNGEQVGYFVTALNQMGESPSSETIWATPMGLPGVPKGLNGTLDGTIVDLTWNPPEEDGGSEITHYVIIRTRKSDGASESFLSQALNYRDAAVTQGETYQYHVMAKNQVGEGPPSEGIEVYVIIPEPKWVDLEVSKDNITLRYSNDTVITGPIIKGNEVNISVSILNLGNLPAANIHVRILANSTRIGNDTIIKELQPGQAVVVEFPWNPDTGSFSLKVMVDPDNTVEESTNENNKAALDVSVVTDKDDTPKKKGNKKDNKGTPGFEIIFLLVAVGLATVILRRKM